MNEEEFTQALESLRGMTGQGQNAWLATNQGQLSQEQLGVLITSVINGPFQAKVQALQVASIDEKASVEADKAQTQIVADGRAAGKSDAQITSEQAARGNDVTGSFGDISESDAARIQTFGGQQEPSDLQLQRFLQFASIANGTTYESWDDYYDSGQYVDAVAQQAAKQQGLEPDDPTSFVFGQGNPREAPTVVRLDAMQKIMSDYPIAEPGDLGSYIQFAKSYGMRDAAGGAAFQPLIALMQATGYFAANDERKSGAKQYTAWIVELNKAEKDLAKLGGQGVGQGWYTAMTNRRDELKRLTSAHVRGNDAVILQPRDLANAYNEGMGAYGNDPFLGFVHAMDPGLAARVAGAYDAENDALNLSNADADLLAQHVRNATPGSGPEEFANVMEGMGLGNRNSTKSQLLTLARLQAALGGGGGGGGGKAERILPDRDAVKQSSKDMYRQLFMVEPSEDQLESFTNQVFGVISSAPDNQSVDAGAQIRKISEGLPEYQKFYGNKPGGMTEQEYQGQFVQAQQSILGAENAGNQAVRVGMQDGAFQTAVGAAAGTKEAADNSTYQGRLARAAQVISGKT